MDINEMTDEALALVSRDLDAERAVAERLTGGVLFASDVSHHFGGIDGRCWDCDARPFGRAASVPCPVERW